MRCGQPGPGQHFASKISQRPGQNRAQFAQFANFAAANSFTTLGDFCEALHLPIGMKFHFSTLHFIFEIEISGHYLPSGRAFCKMLLAKFLCGMHNCLHNFATFPANHFPHKVAFQDLFILYKPTIRIFVPNVCHDWRVWCVLHLPTPRAGLFAQCDESYLVGHLVSAAMCDDLGRTIRAGSLQSHHPHIHPHHTYLPYHDLLSLTNKRS